MPTIADLRQKYPDLAGLDDDQAVDAVHQAFYADLPREQVAESLGVKPPPKPKATRTMGEAITDTGRGVMSGGAGLVKSAGDLYGVVAGDMGNAVSQLGADGQAYWEEGQSDALKEKRADRKAAIDASPSMLGKFGSAIYETLKEPALVGDLVASNVASLIPGAAAGRIVAGARGAMAMRAAQGVGPVAMAEQIAIAKGAGTLGTAAAVGAASVQQGASVSGDTYDDTLKKTAAQLAANPDFVAGVQAKMDAGMDEPGAILATKKELGTTAARAAFLPATAISLAANAIPGGTMLDRVLVGGAARNTLKAGGGRVAAIAKAGIGEGTQEVIEEGGGAFAGNLAKQRYVDPNQDLSESVGENAGLGFVGGLGMGAPAGALHRAAPGDQVREQKLEEIGPLTRGVNAGLEDTAQRVDSGALPLVTADELVTHAQKRLAELDQKADGTKDEKTTDADGEPVTVPGLQPDYLTADEVQERTELAAIKDDPKALAKAFGVQIGTPTAPIVPAAPVETAAVDAPATPVVPAPVVAPEPSVEARNQREADRPTETQGDILPGDRLNKRGGPFLSMPGAMSELGRAGDDTHQIVKVTGGLVVRPKAPAPEPTTAPAKAAAPRQAAKSIQPTTTAQPTTLGDTLAARPTGTRGTTAADIVSAPIDRPTKDVAAPDEQNDQARTDPEAVAPKARADTAGTAAAGSGEGAGVPAAGAAGAQADGLTEHVTQKGKTLRGVWRADLSERQAKAIDTGAFQSNGKGWFIRERSIDKLAAHDAEQSKAEAPTPEPSAAPAAAFPNAATKARLTARSKKVEAGVATEEKTRADYFTPGNIVRGYGGFDEVLAYTPGVPGGHPWSVKVRAVVEQDGKWVSDPKDNRDRHHSTQPEERLLKNGPRARSAPAPIAAPAAPAPATAPKTEASDPLTGDYAAFDGKTLEQQVKVAESGEVAVLRMDAAKTLREFDTREQALRGLLKCLTPAA